MEFDFEVVDSLDKVPSKYQGLYAETEDGKFAVTDAAKALVGEYIGVSKSLAGVRVDKKKVTDENASRRIAVKAVEDLAQNLGLELGDDGAAVVLKTFVEDLQGQVKGGKELKINLDKLNGDWKVRLDEALATKDDELGKMSGALSKHLISDAASRALADSKGSIDLLLPHVVNNCKVVKDENENYSVRVLDSQGDFRSSSDGGWMDVKGLVDEMKTNETFGRAFEAEQAPGVGGKPNSLNRVNTTQNNNTDKSSIDKINAGLAAMSKR